MRWPGRRWRRAGFRRLHDLWSFWNTPRNVDAPGPRGQRSRPAGAHGKKRRQHISTGGQEGGSADVVRGLGALHTLRGLLLDRAGRERLLVPSAAYLEALHGLFGRKDGVATVLGRVNGEVAGAAVGVRFGGTAHLLYAVTTPAARSGAGGRPDALGVDALGGSARRLPCAGPRLELQRTSRRRRRIRTTASTGFKTELGARFCLYAGYLAARSGRPWRTGARCTGSGGSSQRATVVGRRARLDAVVVAGVQTRTWRRAPSLNR